MRSLIKPLPIILILLVTATIYLHQLHMLDKKFLYSDYGKFYQSLHFILEGKNAYTPIYYQLAPSVKDPHPTVHLLGGNLNPPFFSLLLLPLGLLPYAISFYVWEIISVLSGIVSMILLKKALHLYSKDFLLLLGLTAAFFIYYPTYANVWLGQVALFVFPLLLGAMLAAQRGHIRILGILLAIATSIKLFFALFLVYFVVRREWRGLGWYCGSLFIFNALPVVILDKNIYVSYHKIFSHIVWYASSWNASLYGFFMRFFNNSEKNIPLWCMPKLAPIFYYISAFIVIMATIKVLWPTNKIAKDQKLILDFSIVLTAIMLVSPLGWIYYFPYLFIPFIWILKLAHEGHYSYTLRLSTCFIIVLTSMPYYLQPPSNITEQLFILGWASCYTYGLLLLFTLLFFIRYYLNRQPRPTQDKCPTYLTVMLYLCALLSSFTGLFISISEFNKHPKTDLPKIDKLYFGTDYD